MNLARSGDRGTGVCSHPSHRDPISMTGVLIASASTVICEGLPVGLVGDTVVGACGHTGVMVSGASTTLIEGKPPVRLGDSFSGYFSGVLVSASSTAPVS